MPYIMSPFTGKLDASGISGPSVPSFETDPLSVHLAPTADQTIQNPTATTGKTKLIIKAGAGDSGGSDHVLEVQDSGSNVVSYMRPDGSVFGKQIGTTDNATVSMSQDTSSSTTKGVDFNNVAGLSWSNNANWWGGSKVAGINLSGTNLEINNGTAGTLSGLIAGGGFTTIPIVNGSFATDTDWTKGIGWTISTGQARHNSNGSGALTPIVPLTIGIGKHYQLTYTLTKTSGSIIPSLGGANFTQQAASGTYTEMITAINSNSLSFVCSTTARLSIDDVSIQELTYGLTANDLSTNFIKVDADGTYTAFNNFRGILVSDKTNYAGTFQYASGLDGVAVDSNGYVAGGSDLYLNYYSTGSTWIGTGGGATYFGLLANVDSTGAGTFKSLQAQYDASNYVKLSLVGDYAPEMDFYTGGNRHFAFGYDPSQTRSTAYSDDIAGGVWWYPDGVAIGAYASDTYADKILQVPYNSGSWGQVNVNGMLSAGNAGNTYADVFALHNHGDVVSRFYSDNGDAGNAVYQVNQVIDGVTNPAINVAVYGSGFGARYSVTNFGGTDMSIDGLNAMVANGRFLWGTNYYDDVEIGTALQGRPASLKVNGSDGVVNVQPRLAITYDDDYVGLGLSIQNKMTAGGYLGMSGLEFLDPSGGRVGQFAYNSPAFADPQFAGKVLFGSVGAVDMVIAAGAGVGYGNIGLVPVGGQYALYANSSNHVLINSSTDFGTAEVLQVNGSMAVHGAGQYSTFMGNDPYSGSGLAVQNFDGSNNSYFNMYIHSYYDAFGDAGSGQLFFDSNMASYDNPNVGFKIGTWTGYPVHLGTDFNTRGAASYALKLNPDNTATFISKLGIGNLSSAPNHPLDISRDDGDAVALFHYNNHNWWVVGTKAASAGYAFTISDDSNGLTLFELDAGGGYIQRNQYGQAIAVGNSVNAVYLNLNTGGRTIVGTATDDGSNKFQVAGSTALTATESSVNGSVTGSAKFSMPFQGAIYKRVMIRLVALNGTASYTFPTAFSYTPDKVGTLTALVTTLSTTGITITGTTSTGFIEIYGY